MEWTKSSIETTCIGVEAVTGMLQVCGISGVEIVDHQERARYFADSTRTWDYADESLLTADSTNAYIIFYVTNDQAGQDILQAIKSRIEDLKKDSELPDMGSLTIRHEHANDETWLHEWKNHFKPIKIGKVVVVPDWVDYAPNKGDVVFTIDPGSAFGTGQHQTTQLCIAALQDRTKPADKVLDIGCGSGILSIISLLLGAESVTAIDIDPAGAVAATKKNAGLNPINTSNITILSGDVITDKKARDAVGNEYDIVVANIVADVIIPLAPLVKHFIKPCGLFIASGIIDERLHDVIQAYTNAKFKVLAQQAMEGWHCIVGQYNA